jgi:hypothetical protein
MRQGEQITEDSMMHIILKGKVEVIFDGECIGSRHKDDFVGEQALIGRLPRTATVKASGQVQCASISRKQFISLSDDVVRERNSHTPSEDTMPDDATTEQNNVWELQQRMANLFEDVEEFVDCQGGTAEKLLVNSVKCTMQALFEILEEKVDPTLSTASTTPSNRRRVRVQKVQQKDEKPMGLSQPVETEQKCQPEQENSMGALSDLLGPTFTKRQVSVTSAAEQLVEELRAESSNLTPRTKGSALKKGSHPPLNVTTSFSLTGHNNVSAMAIRPQSAFIQVWTLVTLLLFCWRVFYVPAAMAFDQRSPFEVAVEIFFLLDIIIKCMTGYKMEAGGHTQMNITEISYNYFTTWFVVDAVGAIPWEIIYQITGSPLPQTYWTKMIPIFTREIVYSYRKNSTHNMRSHFYEKFQVHFLTIAVHRISPVYYILLHFPGFS